MNRPKVFIAIPNLNGSIQGELLFKLIRWSHDPELRLTIKSYPFMVPHDNCRNQVVKDFLETDCDYLCFIDDDIVPPVNCLGELLKANKDVIAPLCFTMKTDDYGKQFPLIVAYRKDPDGYRPYYGKGIEEVDVVPGGMHLVKKEVYEKIDRPYYFTYHANGTVIYGEEFTFSRQAKEAGYKLYIHYSMLCKHIRKVDVKGINELLVSVKKR